MQAKIFDLSGAETGMVELRDDIFGRTSSAPFLHEAVSVALANRRRGCAHAKTRSEVSGSGKKPWKQKHTGRARAGSIRSPLWRHGGVVFGPRSGRARLDLPRQKARLALAQALSARLADGDIRFVESIAFEEAKTKRVAAALAALGCPSRTLLVMDKADPIVRRACRNLPEVSVLLPGDLDAYRVLSCRRLVMTRPALEALGSRWN